MKQEVIDFFHSVQRHKALVFEYGVIVGGISDERLFNHDASKFTISEFPFYACKFHGDGDDPSGFKSAWLHHFKVNDHHWNHWVKDGIPHVMPEVAIREMVADWLAASVQYTDSYNMTEWLDDHLDLGCLEVSKIKLHATTASILYDVLYQVGYREIDNSPKMALMDHSMYK